MFRLMIFGAIFLGLCNTLQSQNATNPFELLHRLPREGTEADAFTGIVSNPFDVVAHRTPGAATSLSENNTERFNPFAVLPRGGGLAGSLLLTVLVIMFGFLTFSVAANRNAVGKAWRAFLCDNGFTVAQREASGFVGNTPYYLLYINFLLNAGMFVFLVTRVFQKEKFNNLPFLLVCMFGAIAVFFSKHIMLSFLRTFFPVEAQLRKYNFLVIIFNCVLGLFLVPFNLLIAFTGKGNHQIFLVFWMLGLVGIFYAYRSLRASAIGAKFLSGSLFHFLLYLCTVEIAPVALLVKLALMQTT